MKRNLLLSLFAIVIGMNVYSQNYDLQQSKRLVPLSCNRLIIQQKENGKENAAVSELPINQYNGWEPNGHPLNKLISSTKVPAIYEEKIGDTQYDLQTNGAISNRFIKQSNGAISTAWNFVQFGITPIGNNGGTGYNYFDGVNWGPYPVNVVGTHHSFFTSIAVTTSGTEIVIAHSKSSAGMIKTSRNMAGTGTWIDDTVTLGGFVNDAWAKAISGGANGETVHAIWQGSGFYNVPLYGQTGPLLYSRTLDSGVTWPVLRTVIPSTDSSHYRGFGADNYSIDAKNDEVAIVVGSWTTDLILLKSLDNGTTWSTTIIDTFPIAFYNDSIMMLPDTNADGIGDNMEWNSGDAQVMIDNNGICHVWYSKILLEDSSVAETLTGQQNVTDGLYYWNENFGSNKPVIIAGAVDYNNNGIIDIPAPGIVNGMGNYNGGITQMPSSGIDAAGGLYVSYQSFDERADTNLTPGVGHKHVYVIKSLDNGVTWTCPYDVLGASSDSLIQEGVFACMAKNVDTDVNLIYQRDYGPGNFLSANAIESGWNVDPSDIIYVKLSANAFSFCNGIIGINNNLNTNDFNVSQNTPNPSTGITSISFTTSKTDKVTFTINDVVGKVVYTEDRGTVSPGTYTINFNTNQINKGLYFYTIKAGASSATKKMIVE